jgi:hypothetical protein
MQWFLCSYPENSQERALLSAYLAVDASEAELRQFQVQLEY